jgi:hypothetical protein
MRFVKFLSIKTMFLISILVSLSQTYIAEIKITILVQSVCNYTAYVFRRHLRWS